MASYWLFSSAIFDGCSVAVSCHVCKLQRHLLGVQDELGPESIAKVIMLGSTVIIIFSSGKRLQHLASLVDVYIVACALEVI
jgi:hypothetical protein